MKKNNKAAFVAAKMNKVQANTKTISTCYSGFYPQTFASDFRAYMASQDSYTANSSFTSIFKTAKEKVMKFAKAIGRIIKDNFIQQGETLQTYGQYGMFS